MAEEKSVCFADCMLILPLMAASDENLRKGNLFSSCQDLSLENKNVTFVVVLKDAFHFVSVHILEISVYQGKL